MDKAFKKSFILKLVRRIAIVVLISVLWAVGVFEYSKSGEITVILALIPIGIAAARSGIFELIAPGWDGTVTERTMRYITTREKINLPQYFMTVTSDSGREYNDMFIDTKDNGDPQRIEYYDTGERVRKHRGFKYYEKFDKSGKSSVVCIGCGTIAEKSRHTCFNCGLPLLKENIED